MTQYGVLQNSRGVHLVARHDGQTVATKNAIDWFDDEQSAINYIQQIDPDWSDELPQENDEVQQPWDFDVQGRIAELKKKLLETDYVGLADYDKDQPELKAQRQAWREEIRQLENNQ